MNQNEKRKAFLEACEEAGLEMKKATPEELKAGMPMKGKDGIVYMVSKDQVAKPCNPSVLKQRNNLIAKRKANSAITPLYIKQGSLSPRFRKKSIKGNKVTKMF